jgi:hypothetical protein
MKFNREDVVWAAGLFEGEGCLTWHRTCANSKRLRFAASIGMNDKDVLDKFAAIFPMGKVRGPYKDGLGRRVAWQYQSAVAKDVYYIVIALYQFLCSRRKQKIEQFIQLFSQHQRRINRYA